MISFANIALQRLDPFDSRAFSSFAQGDCSWDGSLVHFQRRRAWRSLICRTLLPLRVTVVERGFSLKFQRKTVTLSEGWRFTDTRSRMGITMVGSSKDDFICQHCSSEVRPVRLRRFHHLRSGRRSPNKKLLVS